MRDDARTRLTLVDGMRGIAAVAVMLYHYTSGPLRPTLVELLPWPVFGVLGHGWLGVHVFFVLSGFVIAYAIGDRRITPRGMWLFVLRRQVRLDPPYWASIALAASSAWYLKIKYGGDRVAPSAADIARQAVYLQSVLRHPPVQLVYWSLAIEVQFYLVLITLLAVLGATRRMRGATWLAGLACALTAALSLEAMVHRRVGAEWIVPHWYLFAAGACTHWTLNGRFPRWALLLGLVAMSIVGRETLYLEPCVGAAVAAVLYVGGRRAQLARWLNGSVWQWLGRMSYSIYLVHTVIGGMSRAQLGRRVRDADPAGALVVLTCAVAASLTAAWGLHELIEKPAIRWASKVRWTEPPRART